MRARLLVAVLAALFVAVAPAAGAGEEGPQDRLGAGSADAQPVHRPGRGELPDLGDQLRPARQLQPGQPRAGAGHRRELGRLGRQEDGHLHARRGREVVRRGAAHQQGRQVQPRGAGRQRRCCSRATRRTSARSRRPTRTTVIVVKMKKPDTRIVGGIFVYILPKHIWGEQTVKQLTGSYRPEDADRRQRPVRGHGVRLEPARADGAQPELARRPKPKFDELQWIKYGSADAVERALTLGEVDIDPRGRAVDLRPARQDRPTSRPSSRRRRRSPSCRSTSARATSVPTPSSTRPCRTCGAPGDRLRRRPRARSTRSRSRGTSFPGHGLLPTYYKEFYTEPADDYPYDPDRAKRDARAAG